MFASLWGWYPILAKYLTILCSKVQNKRVYSMVNWRPFETVKNDQISTLVCFNVWTHRAQCIKYTMMKKEYKQKNYSVFMVSCMRDFVTNKLNILSKLSVLNKCINQCWNRCTLYTIHTSKQTNIPVSCGNIAKQLEHMPRCNEGFVSRCAINASRRINEIQIMYFV